MNAIIIHSKTNNTSSVDFSSQVLTESMIKLHIENFKQHGIINIIILGADKKELEVLNINKEIIEIANFDYFNSDLFNNSQEDYLIVESNSISDINLNQFYKKHLVSNSRFTKSISTMNDKSFCSPIIIKGEILRTLPDNNGKLSPELFKVFLNNLKAEKVITDNYKSFNINNYRSYWEFHNEILQKKFIDISYPGIPLSENMWINVNSHVDKSVENDSLVIIGKNSIIHKNVILKGFVVIGNNVIVENNAFIKDTIIMNNSYVGSGASINSSVIKGNFLYNYSRNNGQIIENKNIIDEISA